MNTDDLAKRLRDDAARERQVSKEISDSVIDGFVIPLCEAGLVDDIEPNGEIVPLDPWHCDDCGAHLDPDDLPPCKKCGSIVMRM